ncbi:GGDEF domain-containing protein, partial [Acinetobacter baumannii]
TVISTGALTRLSGVCQDITELRRIEARLRHHDDFDALTGLLSRRRLVAEIDRCVDAVGNRARYGALLLIDIDGFGIYNDSYGPAVGDALLRS